jgi:hypothetical protein
VRGLRRGAHTLDGDVDVLDPIAARVVVLDRAPCGAGLGEEADRLRDASGSVWKAALAVDVERQRRRRCEQLDVRDQLVAVDLHVEPPEREREARARRRERLEAVEVEQPGRARVPRVRHHEEPRLVERTEAGAAIGGGHSDEFAGRVPSYGATTWKSSAT